MEHKRERGESWTGLLTVYVYNLYSIYIRLMTSNIGQLCIPFLK